MPTAEIIDLEELRRIGSTLRRIQADQSTLLSRVDGLERRLAIIEERQAEVEAAIRALGDDLAALDRKMDTVTAVVRDDVARLETAFTEHRAEMDRKFAALQGEMDRRFQEMDRRFQEMDRRFQEMDQKLDAVLAAIAGLRPG
ncbi:MAG: hypothetical protein K2X74_10405 [Acetobacteraceae bacterium]|nr:hypothetical protein [Acetobacteraceae bacterium]